MLGRWLLFASSYSPLFLLGGIRAEDADLRHVLYAMSAVGALSLLAVVGAATLLEPRQRVISQAEDRGPDVAGYMATYLLPLLVLPNPTHRDLVAYGGYILLIGVIYTQSSMVAINPIAYLFGLQLRQVTTATEARMLLISRGEPPFGAPIEVRRVLPGLIVSFSSKGWKVGRDRGRADI